MEILTKSAFKTQELGEKLAASLKKGSASWRIVALYGDLGSGKTTFVQGIARGLGIKQRIVSPTFVFVRSYTLYRPYTLYHIDLYRIQKAEEAKDLGLEEILNDPQNIVVVEWAEKIKKILPSKRIDVKFETLGENERKITTSHRNY